MIEIDLFDRSFNHEVRELIRAFFPLNYNEKNNTSPYLLISREKGNEIHSKLYKENIIKSSIEETKVEESRSYIKDTVKRHVYKLLSPISDKDLPWGILTGIRPGKIVHSLKDKGLDDSSIYSILSERYLMEDEKIDLLLEIVNKERTFIYPLDNEKYSIYVGIPFCPSKCLYCSFTSYVEENYKDYFEPYIDKLLYELRETSKYLNKDKISTIYIGGGTPTSLPNNLMDKLLSGLNEIWPLEEVKEVTVEAGRPDTIDKEVLDIFEKHRVDRISINPQTFSDETLKLIGRKHSREEIIELFKFVKENYNFKINMDLIVGLPGEGIGEITKTMEDIENLSPDNLTVHILSIKRSSNFYNNFKEFDFEDSDLIEDMLDLTRAGSRKIGLKPYYLYRQKLSLGNFENIGYAKKDSECLYNMLMIAERQTILGFGAGSTSKIFNKNTGSIKRLANFKGLNDYINRVEELVDVKLKELKKLDLS